MIHCDTGHHVYVREAIFIFASWCQILFFRSLWFAHIQRFKRVLYFANHHFLLFLLILESITRLIDQQSATHAAFCQILLLETSVDYEFVCTLPIQKGLLLTTP